MTTTTIPSGTNTPNLTITAGNGVDVLNGGAVTSAIVEAGSVATSAGGTSPVLSGPAGTTLTTSAGLIIEAGGTDTGTTIQAGAVELVIGTVTGDTVAGVQFVSGAAAAASNETVTNGGSVDLFLKGSTATNITVKAGGSLNLSGNVTATSTTLDGGTLTIESPKAVLAGSVTLLGTNNTILVTSNQTTSAGTFGDEATPISGFTAGSGDVIDDRAIAPGATVSLTSAASGANELVNITSGGTVLETFDFAPTTNVAGLVLTSDGSGGVEILPCFCPGTRILTETGEVAVEDLRVGDRVVTTSGAVEPIRWIGRRSYAGRAMAGRRHVQPIRIKAGALAPATPKRDLLLSPLHAMLIDGVLVAAHALVNGTTVVREEGLIQVTYIHIELAQHDTVWAEGAASETFIDDDGRFVFHVTEGEPVSGPDQAIYCAPRVDHGFELEAIRRRIAARAELLTA